MFRWAFLILLATSARAGNDAPFYLRGTATNQAIGGINANAIDQSNKQRDRLTTTLTPSSCPAGQSLTGAFYNNGYTFGGTCAASVSSSTGTPVSAKTTGFSGTGTSAGTLGVCIATVTLPSSSGARIGLAYTGSISAPSNTQYLCSFLIDGNFASGYSSTKGMQVGFINAGTGGSADFPFITDILSTGTHSFCLTCAGNGITVNIPASDGAFAGRAEIAAYDLGGGGPQGPVGPAGASGATITVNASMIGDGSSSNPAGVSPSSVAVLVGGFVSPYNIPPAIGASTASLASILVTVGVDTAAIRTQFTLSTQTLSASTSAIRSILDVVGASTFTLSASTFALNASTIALAAQDQRIALSTTALSASTVALSAILDVVGQSTFTLSASTFALNASTISLFNVKASTGINGDITKMVALRSVAGNILLGSLSVNSATGTITVTGGSVTANAYAVPGGLGVSSSCLSTQFLGAQVVAGGIVVGGACVAPSGSGDAVLAATQTFSGSDTFTNPVIASSGTYYNSTSSASVPGTNIQYADNVVKAWAKFNGTAATLYRGFNVKTITNNGAGDYTVTFKNPFADTNYACVCTSYRSAVPNQNIICSFISQTTTAFRLGTYVGGLENTDTVFIMCMGVQ